MIFPDGDKQRKSIPIFDGCVMYFPNALAAVAEVSRQGNEQHNPGEPLHWARGKSMDQYNTALRHLIDHASGARFGADGKRHLAQAAWRVLAALQLDLEAEAGVNNAAPGKPIPGITEPSLQGQCDARHPEKSLDTLRAERDARWEAQRLLEDRLAASPDKWYIPKSIMEKPCLSG